jgi:hypothetical protein
LRGFTNPGIKYKTSFSNAVLMQLSTKN